jgi:hypothetical protein
MVELPQPVEDLESVRIDVAARDGMLGPRDDPWGDHRRAL